METQNIMIAIYGIIIVKYLLRLLIASLGKSFILTWRKQENDEHDKE